MRFIGVVIARACWGPGAGTVIGKCMPRHRAAEFRRFLDTVAAKVPAEFGPKATPEGRYILAAIQRFCQRTLAVQAQCG